MIGKLGLAAAALMISASPVLAASCSEPIAPAQVDGARATVQQMKDAIQDFKTFEQASDDYQSCLINDLHDQEAAAAKAKDPKPLDPSIKKSVDGEVNANQALKEKIGAELNASIVAYKQAHPGK
jgi:hypothetical protein